MSYLLRLRSDPTCVADSEGGAKDGVSINLVGEVRSMLTRASMNFGPLFYIIACESLLF